VIHFVSLLEDITATLTTHHRKCHPHCCRLRKQA